MPPTQAALLTCKECDTVQSIQPHARGNTKLKQRKKADPEHYVRLFAFVTNIIISIGVIDYANINMDVIFNIV